MVQLRWLWGISFDAFRPDEGAVAGAEQNEVIPYNVPSHAMDANDALHIGKSVRKWRPASRRKLITRSKSKVLLEIRESDAASANLTHIAEEALKSLDFRNAGTIVLIHWLCMVHQLYLAVGLVIELAGGPSSTPLVSLLFCVSRVLRTPGYWSTLLAVVPRAVEMTLVVKDSGWDPEFRTRAAVCRDCMIRDKR